ncbi:Long-chain-fatty-acid--CoA ligase 1 [Entomophthora muscae]|uniref:Long-chain-fatty-acid--CoA ligase 1 n=1 Tax=Entomophthora muscae TaxID=34485 RepID=A0ACC2UFH4_9FUNG|nr:Long-chain-fatty-acid--CoA ligase 1 [Entomophthora muscae]
MSSGNCFNCKGDSDAIEKTMSAVAVVEETHADLVTAMLAGALFNFTIDLLSPRFLISAEALSSAFKKIESRLGAESPLVILTPHSKLSRVLDGLTTSGLKSRATVILLDPPPVGFINPNVNSDVKVVLFKDVGSGIGGQQTLPTHPAAAGDVLYRIWSEEGCIEFSDSQVIAAVAGISTTFPIQLRITNEDVYFSPRSIVATSEWATVLFMLHKGCQVGLPTEGYCANLRTLFKPTVTFFSAPEFLNIVQEWGLGIGEEEIGGELVGTATPSPPPIGVIKRYTLQSQLKILKLHRHLQVGGWWDKQIFQKERLQLGGRLRLAYTSSPYLPLAHRNALRVVLGIQMVSAVPMSPFSKSSCANYGWLTIGTFFDYNSDPKLPLAGAPAPSVEAKIVMDRPLDALTEDPVGEMLVRGTSLTSQDAWLSTGLLCRVNSTCSIALLGNVKEPLAISPARAGLRWIETWVAAHDPYVHCLRLRFIEPSALRIGGHVVLRIDFVLKFARNRNIPQDLDQLIKSARLKAQVLQGIQADLLAANSPESAPAEGISPGIPGPIPPLELDASEFTLSMETGGPSAPNWDPEWWE